MPRSRRQRIRDKALSKRGLEPAAARHLVPVEPEIAPPPPDPTGRKTLAMRLVEVRYNQSLEELLDGRKLAEAAAMLGVSESTICRWRKRLGLGHWSQ